MIRITAKGLAKYMTSGDARKRKILRDYKVPDPEGAVQSKYYAEARRVIERYHGGGNDASIIVSAVDELNTKAAREFDRKRDRLRNNIRALESYLSNFGKKKLTILPTPDVKFTHGQVLVSAYPDLYVKDADRHKIIKLDLGKDHPKPEMIKIVLQVMYAGRTGCEPSSVAEGYYLRRSRTWNSTQWRHEAGSSSARYRSCVPDHRRCLA